MYMDDQALLVSLRAGQETAFTHLVKTYHGKLLGAAKLMVGERFAEDVVQETWIGALKSLSNFEGRSSLKTWLFAILANHAKDRLRREARAKTQSLTVEDDSDDSFVIETRFDDVGHWNDGPMLWHNDNPEALLSSDQLRHCLEKIVGLLPESQRMVISLRDGEGVELEDICNILEISDTNVRVLLHRARARLWVMIENFQKGLGC
jgi:RNA polymerase sigma-70 factor (ECF subfamily)